MTYEEFLEGKAQLGGQHGFKPLYIPDFLFDFQKHLTNWAIEIGRGAILADCGLGKSPMLLTFAENVVRHTNLPVLILAPLAVSAQLVREAAKFDFECTRSMDGVIKSKIVTTNYDRLHYFNPNDFAGVVCDESSCLKNFDGATKSAVTEFMRKIKYRLLCTATAAPNDYIELGTSSEALGNLGYMDMLGKYFKNDQNSNHPNRLWSGNGKWRFRGHAERNFWRWVCSWARAVRYPSDLGFSNDRFMLPELVTKQYVVTSNQLADGFLLALPAHGLKEQRGERKRTMYERCQKASDLIIGHKRQSIAWCHLNTEGDLLEKIIPDCVQISGSDSDDEKEEKLMAFVDGKVLNLVTKPTILGFGINLQCCDHQTWFPSHSFEQFYQGVRRSWRFGQYNPVQIDIVTSEGEAEVLKNLNRKMKNAEIMFSRLVTLMNEQLHHSKVNQFTIKTKKPSWLLSKSTRKNTPSTTAIA